MPQDLWAAIQRKLESAESHLQQASRDIQPHYAPIPFTGAIVSNPGWRAKLSSHLSSFLVDCRSVPDIIQSYFGVDSQKWVKTLSRDEQLRRNKFQKSFRYKRFVKLRLSRARVDTVHRQGFPEIWGKAGKRYSPLECLPDTATEHIVAGSDPALQWAATLPPRPVLYVPSDFYLKTAGGRYTPLFPECLGYLRRTQELVGNTRKLYEKVHNGHSLTEPRRA